MDGENFEEQLEQLQNMESMAVDDDDEDDENENVVDDSAVVFTLHQSKKLLVFFSQDEILLYRLPLTTIVGIQILLFFHEFNQSSYF